MSYTHLFYRQHEDLATREGSLPSVSDEQAITMVEGIPRQDMSKLEKRVDHRFTPYEGTIDEIMRKDLSDKQLRAIDLIIGGLTDKQVAQSIKAHRVTVTRWRLYHPSFVSELNRRRDDVLRQHATQLLILAERAIGVLAQRLSDDSRPELQVKAAVSLLKLAGTGKIAQERGPTAPDDIVEALAYERRRKNKWGMIDHGEREDVLIDLARRAESVEGVSPSVEATSVPLSPSEQSQLAGGVRGLDGAEPLSLTEAPRNEHAPSPCPLPEGEGSEPVPFAFPPPPLLQNPAGPTSVSVLRSAANSVTLPVPQFQEEGAIFHGI